MNFLLSAGEASGDTYGAQLAEALRELSPVSTFFGMGGEKMRAFGASFWFMLTKSLSSAL
ncbi:MAG TPA: hypothetical protein VGK24_01300 [Candidatus Angelobacter sp.]|jgi:lipid-A-disaccharide synthase